MISPKLRFIREYNRIYRKALDFLWHIQGCDSARIYMFHSVLDNKSDLYSKFAISTSSFKKFIEYELSRGQTPMKEDDLIKAIDKPYKYNNHFAVSFDDIYDSVFTNAYPILKKKNIPFIIFLTPSLIGKIDEDPHSFKPMITMEHLNILMSDNLCILGSHGMEHMAFRKYSNQQVSEALSESKRWLDSTFNKSVSLFAFPFGRKIEVSDENISELSQSCYQCGFSALDGSLKQKWFSSRWFLPRILVSEDYVSKHCK